MSMGARIKEERERLGYSQEAFGEKGGVSKRSQIMYEQNKTDAGATYFTMIAVIGADVQYILTGMRSASAPMPKEKPLNRQQKDLLDNYDNSSAEGKKAINATASALAQSTITTKVA